MKIATHPFLQHAAGSPLGEVLLAAARIAAHDGAALIMGEAGVGAAEVAQLIHDHGSRRARPLVRVACGGASEASLHRCLFGEDTDLEYRAGLFGAARQGTLVLEEISALPLGVQARLMNAMFMTGSTDALSAGRSVQLLATSTVDLATACSEGRFRRDLLDLFVCSLVIPPLRVRRDDAVAIANACWAKLGHQRELSSETLEFVRCSQWAGNAAAVASFAAQLSLQSTVDACCPSASEEAPSAAPASMPLDPGEATDPSPFALDASVLAKVHARGMPAFLDELECALIAWALQQRGGVRLEAAKLLGVKRTTLVEKLRRREALVGAAEASLRAHFAAPANEATPGVQELAIATPSKIASEG